MIVSIKSVRAVTILGASLVFAQSSPTTYQCPADPYADPAADYCNPLRYIPTLGVNILAAVLYFLVAILLCVQNYRFRANYMLCLIIGAYTEGFGLAMRLALRKNPHSEGVYIVMYLFVVLSPCAFLAANYILLGRLVRHLDGSKYLHPLKARLVSRTFICSDICTFLIQAAGGSISTSHNPKMAQTGSHVFLIGIALQLGSFIIFSCLWGMFAYRVRFQDQLLWSRPGWKPLHWCIGFSSIFFLIRSVYRTIELSQGYGGYLETHEVFFLTLDTLPLFIGITSYVWFWPGKYITSETKVKPVTQSPTSITKATRKVDGGGLWS